MSIDDNYTITVTSNNDNFVCFAAQYDSNGHLVYIEYFKDYSFMSRKE